MSGNSSINARRRRRLDPGIYNHDMQAMRLDFIGQRNGDVLPERLMGIYGVTHAQAVRDLERWRAHSSTRI